MCIFGLMTNLVVVTHNPFWGNLKLTLLKLTSYIKVQRSYKLVFINKSYLEQSIKNTIKVLAKFLS